jgi:uncharacterized lipoprotein
MRILILASAAALLAGCGTSSGLNRDRPDEFAVARNAPLVVPPDFALRPPQPGAASPSATDSRTQAIQALFGGPAQRSASERQVLSEAESDRATPGARSVVGDPDTNVVDKGNVTQTILAVPEGNGQEASVSTPQ